MPSLFVVGADARASKLRRTAAAAAQVKASLCRRLAEFEFTEPPLRRRIPVGLSAAAAAAPCRVRARRSIGDRQVERTRSQSQRDLDSAETGCWRRLHRRAGRCFLVVAGESAPSSSPAGEAATLRAANVAGGRTGGGGQDRPGELACALVCKLVSECVSPRYLCACFRYERTVELQAGDPARRRRRLPLRPRRMNGGRQAGERLAPPHR